MNNLDFIRQKCVEANPEKWNKVTPVLRHFEFFRLADVLLAMRDNWVEIRLSVPFVLFVQTYPNHATAKWDCRQDDLIEQDEETLAFLADLLK